MLGHKPVVELILVWPIPAPCRPRTSTSKLTSCPGGLLKVEVPHRLGHGQAHFQVCHSLARTSAISEDEGDEGTPHSCSRLLVFGGVFVSFQPPLGAEDERLREVFRVVHQAVCPHADQDPRWDDVTVHDQRLGGDGILLAPHHPRGRRGNPQRLVEDGAKKLAARELLPMADRTARSERRAHLRGELGVGGWVARQVVEDGGDGRSCSRAAFSQTLR